MRQSIGSSTIELVQGDITLQQVDAIVNAANSRLAGGGGVDGAIHRRGGPTIMAETRNRYPQGCPTGSAVITAAGDLLARWVIHAVGPVWHGGNSGEPAQLTSAYRRSLELAAEQNCRSIAFPAISAGVYSYPLDLAAAISIETVRTWLGERSLPELVRFVLFDDRSFAAFGSELKKFDETKPEQ